MDHHSSSTLIYGKNIRRAKEPDSIAKTTINPGSGLRPRPMAAAAIRVGGTTYARVLLLSGQTSVLGRRTPHHVAICQVLKGRLRFIPGSPGQEPCRPGQICFWNAAEPAQVEAIDSAVLLVTYVARDVLGGIGVDPRSAPNSVNPPSVLSLATARFIEGILESDGIPDPATAHLVEKLTHELVGSMLLGGRADPTDATALDAQTFARAMKLMTAQRANTAVTPATIAADLHVSLRQLQREFSRRGATVAGSLRRLRAELAASILRDPAYGVLTISQIAHHSGFTSSQQMRRVLAATGFSTPLELRKTATCAGQSTRAFPARDPAS